MIDVSYVLTFSGAGGLFMTFLGAALRFDADRLARVVVFGNLLGAGLGMALFPLAAAGVL